MTDQIRFEFCPFCGSDDISPNLFQGYSHNDHSQLVIAAGCKDCGATGPKVKVDSIHEKHDETAELWNRLDD